MDFVGQLFCERTFQFFILLSGIIGWIMGYMRQDFKITCYFLACGSALSAVVCLPDWPWWNRHPLDWLPARNSLPPPKKRVKEGERKHGAADGTAGGAKAGAAGAAKKGGKPKKA